MPVIRGRNVRVLFDAPSIAARNAEIAAAIARAGYRDLLVVSILKGSFVFAADLLRALHVAGLSPEVEFISLGSYGAGTTSSGRTSATRYGSPVSTSRTIRARRTPWSRKLYFPSGSFSWLRIRPTQTTGSIAGRP